MLLSIKKIIYRSFTKVIIDIVLAFILLLFCLPIFIIISAILLITDPGPPIFLQKRPGKEERTFRVIKFRTMSEIRDNNGKLLPPVNRITPFGRFLRRFSLDELPQLLNVLKGDMSLVGPRPLRIEYISLYNNFQRRRHEVKPGITGWAQVNGRNAISWEEKFKLDIWYIENMSFILDIKIMYLTFIKVFKMKKMCPEEHVIMKPFKGIRLEK